MNTEKVISRDNDYILHTYGRSQVVLAEGKGMTARDADGKEYVDLLAGIAVTGLGHCNEEIAEVISRQARKLIHVSNLFYQEEQLDFAEKLLATSHAGKVFFCNSGAEANEAAIKIARRYQQAVRGRDAWRVITLENCFHGIALDDPHDGQPDARVARCGFDDRLAGRQPSVPLGGLDHPQRNAVLDASRRIEAFEFGEYFHVRIGAQPVDPHHRGRADGPQNILFNHKSPLIKPRKDNHFPEKRLIL